MSTETTKKKIKIDNGTNYAYTYTDKAIDAKMPTDINVDANGFAILEHDGSEIAGQKKKVKFAQIDKSASFNQVTIPTASSLKTVDGTGLGLNILSLNLKDCMNESDFNELIGYVLQRTVIAKTYNIILPDLTGIDAVKFTTETDLGNMTQIFYRNSKAISQFNWLCNWTDNENFMQMMTITGFTDDAVTSIKYNGIEQVDVTDMPTDLKATATNLSLIAGSAKIGSGINLSGFEWDEATKTLKAKGGSSPTLNLIDMSGGKPRPRTSISEEEKTNLEKGLYNSVLYFDPSLGDSATTSMLFPQRLVGLDGDFMFSSYKAIAGRSEAGDWTFLGASTYGLSIGEKTSDGNYPITINKINDVKGIQTIGATISINEATGDITVTTDSAPSGDMFILSPTQSEESGIGNVLMVRQPDGNYSGFWSISDDTVVCYVKPDGTGFAFYAPTTFLFHSTRETDGKVLTIESGVPRWLDPVSSLPAITSADVGKFLTVKSDQKTAWGSVPQGSPIEIVLDESKPYFNLGEYNKKIGVYLLSRPNNAILYEAKFDNDSATFTKILLYGSMKASAQNVDYLDVSGSLYGLNGDSTLAYIGSGIWQLKSEDNYKFLPYPYSQEASLCCSGGISGAIPSFTLYGSAIGKTSPDYIGLLPQVCKYCALRYDFKKTSSTTDTEKVTSAFFGSVSADNVLTPTKITLIGIFDNGMGKAVLEKNTSGVFESKTPIEYVEDVNAITYSKARYKHTVTLKTSAGAILWTQTLSNSKNTPVTSYQDIKTLFGGELLAGYGEYAQLNLHGGTEATDKLIKLDGTEATLASLGTIVYSDDCFLPK